jgi:hypothetical protein
MWLIYICNFIQRKHMYSSASLHSLDKWTNFLRKIYFEVELNPLSKSQERVHFMQNMFKMHYHIWISFQLNCSEGFFWPQIYKGIFYVFVKSYFMLFFYFLPLIKLTQNRLWTSNIFLCRAMLFLPYANFACARKYYFLSIFHSNGPHRKGDKELISYNNGCPNPQEEGGGGIAGKKSKFFYQLFKLLYMLLTINVS